MKHITITLSFNITEEGFRSEDIRNSIREIRNGKTKKEMFEDPVKDGVTNVDMQIHIK